jgi:outer membrane immunogenic protein
MIFRCLAAALAVAVASALPAGAADLGRGRGAPPPASYDQRPSLAIERWTGFYFGATLGYSVGTVDVSGASGNLGFDQSGGVGTLFAGYNWQAGNMVWGLEADIGTGYLDGGRAGLTAENNYFGTLRARVGTLITQQTLLYATGGLAWADYDFKMTGATTGSETLIGYTIGGGLEFAIAPQWTIRGEYLYTDLGSERIDHTGLSNTYSPDSHTFRAGLAIKF